MNVTRYRAGERRYLAVDAEHYVPDRAAFAARVCDGEDGVARAAEEGATVADGDAVTSVRADREIGLEHLDGERPAADGGAQRGDLEGDGVNVGADGVLFLALEPEFTPPRVVMTVVHPDGDRTPCCTRGVRCAARWVAERTGADRVMVDTQAGTREARIHDDGSVSVEVADAGEGRAPGEVATERAPVVREFAAEVPQPTP